MTTASPTRSTSRILVAQLAAVAGVALIVIGLWGWAYSGAWAQRAEQPATAIWAVRLGALAVIAGAQVLFALVVIPGFFRRATLERAYAALCGITAGLAAVGAVALAASAW